MRKPHIHPALSALILIPALWLSACGGPGPDRNSGNPDPGQVLAVTRSIADKILRETSFEFRMVPFTYNAGVSHLQIRGIHDGGYYRGPSVYYGLLRIESEQAEAGALGLSYQGNIRVYLNGREVFSGSSTEATLQEYTYNRFSFMEELEAQWKEGENLVLVRCDLEDGPVTVLMMPLDELDAMPGHLSTVPVVEGVSGLDWLVGGPWAVSEDFMPDLSGEPPADGWQLQPVPMVHELVIDPSNSYLRDSYADWHYANGGTLLGILGVYDVSGDRAYIDHVNRYMETLAANLDRFRDQYLTMYTLRGSYHRIFRKTMLDDTGGPAIPLADMFRRGKGIPELESLLDTVFRYVLHGQERLDDGTYSRPEPEPATIWADDLFMVAPFLLRMAEVTGDQDLYNEVVHQVLRFNHYLQDEETGLYFHGWYDRRGENTPVRWGRANGWIAWATAEVLEHLPGDHPQYEQVLDAFRSHMEALAGVQDASGMWHQVLDHPETYEETSCTAMFTLAMARGVRLGWLNGSYREHALRGWAALQDRIGDDGTVTDICRGTGIGDSVEWYDGRKRFDHDPRGLGAMLRAGCEIYRLAGGPGISETNVNK